MLHADAICTRPSTALTAKKITMIGLKKAATLAVPRLWAPNRTTRMTIVAGRMYGARSTSTCFSPSSADRTEIAGVIMASPENSADPTTPRKKASVVFCPSARCASALSDRMPPSPLLSASIRNSTYFPVTTIRSAQMMSETTPITSAGPSAEPLNWPSAVCSA